MKAFARFSLIAVVVLVGVLLGSWAYLTIRYGSIEEFVAGASQARYWRPGPGASGTDELESGCDSPKESVAECAAREVKPGRAPVEEPSPGDDKQSQGGAGSGMSEVPAPPDVEAEALDEPFEGPAVTVDGRTLRGSASAARDFLIIRTRSEVLSARPGYLSANALHQFEQLGLFKPALPSDLKKTGPFYLRGRVIDHLTRKPLAGAVVALVSDKPDRLETPRAVTNEEGHFALPVSEHDHTSLVHKKSAAPLAVYLDGYELHEPSSKAGKIEPDSNAFYSVRMQRSRGLRVRVSVENPVDASCEVRVWAELRSDLRGPLFDDHIFMSVPCPAKGGVEFHFPLVAAGVLRVGAVGWGWACEAVREADPSSSNYAHVGLRLIPESTCRVEGKIDYTFTGGPLLGGGRREALPATRLSVTDSRSLTYANVRGDFEFYAVLSAGGARNWLQLWHQGGIDCRVDLDEPDEEAKKWASLVPGATPRAGPWRFHFLVQPAVNVKLPPSDVDTWGRKDTRLFLTDGVAVEKPTWYKPGEFEFRQELAQASSFVLARNQEWSDGAELMRKAIAIYAVSRESSREFSRFRLNPARPGAFVTPLTITLERRR